MYGIIYCATCTITGKKYIGKTTQGLSTRKVKHLNASKNKKFFDYYFYRAINLYGWETFTWETLEEVDSKDLIDKREKWWIIKYDTRNHTYGYNIQPGGEGAPLSERTKQKIRETKLGDKNPMYGKTGSLHHLYGTHPSDETLEKLRSSHQGKKLSPESIVKRSETRRKNGWNKKKRVYHTKSVYQFNLDNELIMEYYSVKEAEIALGVKNGNIAVSCRSRGTKKAYGYYWKYGDKK